MHLNDPEGIAREALRLAEAAATHQTTSEVVQDTRAGYGYRERALTVGIVSAVCTTLRDMFEEGVELDQAAKEKADAQYADDLEQRERDLEERELALAQRQAALGLDPTNQSIGLVAEATPEPRMNDGAAERAADEDRKRQESIDRAAAIAHFDPEADRPITDTPADPDLQPISETETGEELEQGPGPQGEAAGQEKLPSPVELQEADKADELAELKYADLQAYAEEHGVSKTDDGGKMRSKAALLELLGVKA